MKDNQLSLREMEIIGDSTIVFHFDYKGRIRKYLSSRKFFIKYDEPVSQVDESILTIPFVGGLLTTSWLSATDLVVETLDSVFSNSLEETKRLMNKFYPEIGFNSEVKAGKTVNNGSREKGLGLLFSGGIDSTTLYIQNRDRKPALFMLLGGVVPIHNKPMIENLRTIYSRFAEREGIDIHFMESNIRDVLNESLLMAKYGKYLRSYPRARSFGSWWEGVNHGIIQLCFTAPITYGSIDSLKIASTPGMRGHGSNRHLVKTLKWGNVEVIPDGYRKTRNEKIKQTLKPFIEETNYFPKIQLCNYAPVVSEQLNCGSCYKCTRNILMLLLEEIDPRKCGFPIIRDFYGNLRNNVLRKITSEKKWLGIQRDLNSRSHTALPQDFAAWFKELGLQNIKSESTFILGAKCMFQRIYSKLPHEVQKRTLKQLYYHQYVKEKEQIKFNAQVFD